MGKASVRKHDRYRLVSECPGSSVLTEVITCVLYLAGFCVLSKVVDRKTLNLILFSVISFFATAIPLIMALMPEHHAEAKQEQCVSTEAALMSFSSAVLQLRDEGITCISLNATLDSYIVGDGGH